MISRCWEEARATLERQTWQDQWLANSSDFCYTNCVLLLVSFLETCVRMCQIFFLFELNAAEERCSG